MKRKHDIAIERATDCWLTKQPERLQARLIQFRRKMERERFRPTTVQLYLARGREFLEYLERNEKQPESAGPSDIDAFLQVRLAEGRNDFRTGDGDIPALYAACCAVFKDSGHRRQPWMIN